MKEKIPGGFDSPEVSDNFFADNDNNFSKDKTEIKYDNPETMLYMRKMRDAYAKKLSNLGKHISQLYEKADNSDNKNKVAGLQTEADSLFEDWEKIESILEKLEDHTDVAISKDSLN